ncbi:MAG: winged helix-turn-helix domain-containing protein [Anaerolineales bacterium]|jgi:DNA-binding winged helix-turn-helix (wHTH) protein
MKTLTVPFSSLAERVLASLVAGDCVSITGLSNMGKSTFMRALSTDEVHLAYQKARQKPVFLIYVDCNRAVDISPQAFFEVVLRSVLERLNDQAPPDLAATMRDHHQEITASDSAFSASLTFNLALTELCEQLGHDLCLLIDEFDEVYAQMEERTLLNLRALHDRFSGCLAYVTATERSLPLLRQQEVENEFAEMFSRTTFPMPLLSKEEIDVLLDSYNLPEINQDQRKVFHRLSGGHPGLLLAVSQVLSMGLEGKAETGLAELVRRAPGPRTECLKIWNQLTADEQAGLSTLVLEAEAKLPHQQMQRLERLGMVREDKPFSPIFAEFVARRRRGPEVGKRGVHLDADSGDVWVDGVRIPVLTDLEFRLLQQLYERRDKITDKYRIVTSVWGEEYLGEVDDARVEKLVSRLRSKIEPDPTDPIYLITQRGRGYKLLSKPREA